MLHIEPGSTNYDHTFELFHPSPLKYDDYKPFSQQQEICSLLNLYHPWPLQTNLCYLWQTQLDLPIKTCSDTNRRKFEAVCWLLVQTCQNDRQGHEFLPSRPAPLGKTYRCCSGPWSTSHLHWLLSGKLQNINHPKWIGLTVRIGSKILILLMQLHCYSFSSMICSCGSGQLRCGLCFPVVLSVRSWSRFL